MLRVEQGGLVFCCLSIDCFGLSGAAAGWVAGGPGVCPPLRGGFPAVLGPGRPAKNSPSNTTELFCFRQTRSSNSFAGRRCAAQPSRPCAPRLLFDGPPATHPAAARRLTAHC